ncbi:MAG TPA: energy transducer TonB [Vicinamibacteria bacterium]
MLGGCALNAPRPYNCDATTGTLRPVTRGRTPLSRWIAECAKEIAEASWPPRHAEGLEGSVVVKAFFNRNGRPLRAEITSSSGSDVLDAHAKKTVLRATCPFAPKSVTQKELLMTTLFHYGGTRPVPCSVPVAAPASQPAADNPRHFK